MAEFSLVTVDRSAIDKSADSGDRRSGIVRRSLHELSFQLSAAQLGITLAALLSGYLAEPALAKIVAPLIDLALLNRLRLVAMSRAFLVRARRRRRPLRQARRSRFGMRRSTLRPKTIAS